MKRILINATQPEELRLAIVDGQRLLDLDIESQAREQRKGNVYKARITRIEPSLEACFVDYGEERQGFLSLREISPEYFNKDPGSDKFGIRDVLKEGQELIIQVDKEERGTKGAAMTTYISLAGRYLVLMPNNPKAGGVSRRIDGEDRADLREAMGSLELPAGMGAIARTAGVGRSAEELQWDLNYLLDLWQTLLGATYERKAPFLIYQESNIIIRALRDYLKPDIGEIVVDEPGIYAHASEFMRMVMPAQQQKLKLYADGTPLFSRYQIESQIESAHRREVRLPSGGSIVIDATEALTSIDINSARSTGGASIEETALHTNLEAADEIARQLRLRDLGGLVVIDFIDMNASKNQREVENRLRDACELDRARIQLGRISRFGLLEMSRQRLRPSLREHTHLVCPRCDGQGMIRTIESTGLLVLRLVEEEALKEKTGRVIAQLPAEVATYLLNEKRGALAAVEKRTEVQLTLVANPHLESPQFELTRVREDQLDQSDYNKVSHALIGAAPPVLADPTQAESSGPRRAPQTPAVSGVLPSSPAPVSAADSAPSGAPGSEPAPAPRNANWLARLWQALMAALGGGDTQARSKPSEEQKPARKRGNGRSSSSSSGASSNNRGRGGRSGGRNGGSQRGSRRGSRRGDDIVTNRKSAGESGKDGADKDGGTRDGGNKDGGGRNKSGGRGKAAGADNGGNANNTGGSSNRRGGRKSGGGKPADERGGAQGDNAAADKNRDDQAATTQSQSDKAADAQGGNGPQQGDAAEGETPTRSRRRGRRGGRRRRGGGGGDNASTAEAGNGNGNGNGNDGANGDNTAGGQTSQDRQKDQNDHSEQKGQGQRESADASTDQAAEGAQPQQGQDGDKSGDGERRSRRGGRGGGRKRGDSQNESGADAAQGPRAEQGQEDGNRPKAERQAQPGDQDLSPDGARQASPAPAQPVAQDAPASKPEPKPTPKPAQESGQESEPKSTQPSREGAADTPAPEAGGKSQAPAPKPEAPQPQSAQADAAKKADAGKADAAAAQAPKPDAAPDPAPKAADPKPEQRKPEQPKPTQQQPAQQQPTQQQPTQAKPEAPKSEPAKAEAAKPVPQAASGEDKPAAKVPPVEAAPQPAPRPAASRETSGDNKPAREKAASEAPAERAPQPERKLVQVETAKPAADDDKRENP